ncbi:hypothetical protein A2933_01200 [Candidatus Nomurabacteria bacterium RIFCSPLOWO2_01_FULL_46_18]|uniref:RecF/RecN/SMC N-terminal domain-containing protein n=1 Tax=Candidatus Nomurabacteria bacterium RIFCSPLOWO2_01_FULL_46_18 TaxID=1801783 RepID=A0A1F6XDR3_9BACT|nr:MAG: hypothetical protein A2933_01200 [Candidatus Nomurabacteria bacterium RIFCSPLOWO2_01_FULL_46_18]
MRLETLELHSFKSFSQKTLLGFKHPVVAIVGPNGSGKSNVVEAFRFVLGEQSMKSMRGKLGADLIFKGSKSLQRASRGSATIYLNNSDRVFKLTNDGGEAVGLNYDVISISREVYPDGLNKYILNGSEVRLKDINNLLASVNIGASGHHIISQGEADRILNANSRERREMVEDALGLKIYQYKIRESERKLERTEENMKEAMLLRRENAPHLNFLKKQVEKFAKSRELRDELASLYRDYFQKESVYLGKERASLSAEGNKIGAELKRLASKVESREEDGGESEKIGELRNLEQKRNKLSAQKNEIERKLGRTEGMIEIKEGKVKFSDVCPFCGSKILSATPEQIKKREEEEKDLAELKNSRTQILAEVEKTGTEERAVEKSIEFLKETINKEISTLRDREKEKYALKLKEQELHSTLEVIKVKEENLKREDEAFENELKEGEVLVGPEILSYKNHQGNTESNRAEQEENRKKIERIKIKLEDAGEGSGAEIRKEFEEMAERDKFLEKEMGDLSKGIESLEQLISGLKEKIDLEFKEGVEKINVEFKELFALMFGGGNAKLVVTAPVKRSYSAKASQDDLEEVENKNEPQEEGIEINVSLPQKKVKELNALSGGERSLVSIALLFAMSQVNPPPFLVLDETDAALDESNSRKFGDMLEKLSKQSQLVVVTHNRETMSRADVLYGVTIGSDGASKLLSVKLAEAEAIAE